MDKKLTSNYIYSVIYQLLIVVTPFITTPYLTRVMGLTVLSINDFTGNLIQWFVLFGIMGVNIYGNREIARVRDDKKLLSKTFFEIFSMQFLSMILSSFAFVIFLVAFKPDYINILLIQGITLLSVSLDITWFFYGVEDFKKASIRNMIVKIVNVCLILILIKGPNDLEKFVYLNTILGVCGQFIMWLQLKQYISFEKINLKGVLKHIKPNLTLFIPQIAISVYSLLDITMLGYLYNSIDHVNLYRQSQQFVKMFLFFITSLGSVMLPRVANVFVKGDMDSINNYLNKTFKIALYLSIPMIFGIFGVIQNFINWFLPPEYAQAGLLIKCAAPIILFISLSNVFGTQYMVPVGDFKKYTISVISGAIINFCINYTLIPSYGAYGAIIGSVAAEFAVTLIQWIYVKDKLKVSIEIKELFLVIFSSLVMGLVTYFTGVLLGSSFIVNLIQIGFGGLTYLIILYLFKASLLMEVLQRFKKGSLENGNA